MALQLNRYRFTVDEYNRMAEVGIFTEDDRVELIEGEIVKMSAIGPHHAAIVRRLSTLFFGALAHVAQISVQNPIRLDDHSEPEPDLALVHPRDDYYASGHPGPSDVFLIVEVADTSVASDRRAKIPLYARGGIREVWLADVENDMVFRHREPSLEGYRRIEMRGRGERIAPEHFPDAVITVDDILG